MQRIGIFFLIIAIVFLSNGCLSTENLLKSPIFLVLMALSSIVGCVSTPMFLAQHAAISNLTFLGIW